MKRRLLILPAALALAVAVYFVAVRETSVAPRLLPERAAAVIGSGSEAVAVAPNGELLSWLPPPREGSLPRLPIEAPPKDGRLHGPVLEQAKVLGAAPPALRPYLERSYFGESGVDVKLTSGVELRFGDSDQAARKWRSAAAVLADPNVTTLDYVDLHTPGRPAVWGSGHTLPPPP